MKMIVLGRTPVLLVMVVGLATLLGLMPAKTDAIRLSEFFPFGPDYDEALPIGNDPTATVILAQPIPYFGQIRDRIIVENDGVLELQGVSSSAFVYAFSADVDTTGIGQVFYRETTDPSLLLDASLQLQSVFPDLSPISLTSLFIATWFYVGYFDNNVDRTNTFQCLVGTDGSRSFVGLFYADEMIEWMTGDADGGVNGLGGDRADVGFVSEISANSYFLPVSNTSAVLMLDSLSNVGLGGVWLFRIDQDMIIRPTDDIPPVGSGSGSGSGSGNGNGLFGASCVEAGFTECCVGDESACTVGPSPIECSCSRDCFFSENNTCCHDITVVPCFPEISVLLTTSPVTVQEGEPFALVTVSVSGFPDDPFSFRVPVEVYILLYTGDISAEAPSDYEGVVRVLEFFENGVQMISIDINDDAQIEETESFFVNISTTDDYVNIIVDSVQVFIEDNDGTFMVAFSQPFYVGEENSGTVEVCVDALSPTSQLTNAVSLLVTTESGTATDTAPVDYTNSSIEVVFSPGSPSQTCVQIPLENDNIFETQETFSVALENVLGTTPTMPLTATVIINDDDSVIVGFNDSSIIGAEGGPSAQACLRVFSGVLETDIVFSITVTELTASNLDIIGGPFILSLLSGTEFNCLQIPIVEDEIPEGDESFILTAQAIGQDSDRVLLSSPTTLVTIEDNDEALQVTIGLELATYSASESDTVVSVCVTVGASALPSGSVQYRIQTIDESATAGLDYGSLDMVVSITSTPDLTCFPIAILTDSVIENEERFDVQLSSDDASVIIDRQSSMVFIADINTITIQFMPAMYSVFESDLSVDVCVSVPDSVQLQRTISYSVSTEDDSAIAGLDYSDTTESVTVSSTPFTDCTTIPIQLDSVVENTEQFFAVLTSTDPAVQVTQDATVEILDVSEVQVSFVTTTNIVNENDGSVQVCLLLTGQLERSLTVTISTVPDTATAPGDYMSFAGLPVVFSTSPSQECVNVTIVNDNAVEQNEEFLVELDLPPSDLAVSIGALDQTTVLILDDDIVTCGIILMEEEYSALEGDGVVTVCLQLIGQSSVDVSVQLETVAGSGTATAGVDYVPFSGPVVFPATSSGDTQCQNLTLLDDSIEESDETFQIRIFDSACLLSQTEATVTIIDDDGFNLLSLSQPTYVAVESQGQVQVCIQSLIPVFRDAPATIVTVDQTALSGVDYVGGFFTVTLPAGESEVCLNISIIDDTIAEGTVTFLVFLNNVDPGVDANASMSTVQILNDDDQVVSVTFELGQYDAAEGQSSVEVCAVTDLTPAPGQTVSVLVSTEDGTASAGSDYIALVSEVLTFSSTSLQRQCVNIVIIDDSSIEPIQQFFVRINQDVSSQAVVSIADNDGVSIQFVPDVYTALETDDVVEVCVSVPGSVQLERPITYSVQTVDGTANAGLDYTETVEAVTVSSTPSIDCTSIPILEDSVVENKEQFFVVLNTNDPAVSTLNSATVDILDNSVVEVSFAASTNNVNENDGSVEVCLLLTGQLERTLNVTVSTVPGTATAPGDYMSFARLPVVFNTAPSQECVNVIIVNDDIVEPMEVFEIELDIPQIDSAVSIGTLDSTMVLITDDDSASCGIILTSPTFSGVEGDGIVTVCAQLIGQPMVDVSVQLETVPGSGTATAGIDYVPFSGPVVFPASASGDTQCQNLTLLDDNTEENDETFQIRIFDSACLLSQTEATVTIIDDDELNLLSFSQSTFSVVESQGSAEVCIQSLIPVVRDSLATIVTMPDTATDGVDYTGGIFTVILPAGESEVCLNIPIIDNSIADGTRTFLVFLNNNDPGVDATASVSTVQIIDDDDDAVITVTFEQATYSVIEGQPSVEVCAVTSAVPVSGQTISVQVSTQDDSATAGSDYSPLVAVVLTFTSASSQRQCVDISILDDNLAEPIEQFFVQLTQTATQQTDQAVVIVTDNDVPTEDCIVSLFGASTVAEDLIFVAICVQIDSTSPLTNAVSVNYNTVPLTATADVDYESVSTVFTFGVGTTFDVTCPQISLINDAIAESDETFQIQIATASCQVPQNTFTVTIQDDGDAVGGPVLGFSMLNYQVSESLPSVDICVQSSVPLLESATATVTTSDGTATDGLDYTGGVVTLTIAVGESEACATYAIINDDISEGDESFSVALSSSDLAVDPLANSAVVTIIDDDVLSILFEEATYTVNEQAGSLMVCAVAPDSLFMSVTVVVQATGGTAQVGSDYTGLPALLSFTPAGDRRQCLTLTIVNDAIAEPTESIQLLLSDNLGGTVVAPAQATVLITDDDGGTLTVTLEQAVYSFNENANPDTVMVCVDLMETFLDRQVDIVLSLRQGSALSNVDFIPETAVITFDPINSEPIICEMIELINDIFFEDTEEFFVDLSTTDPAVTFIIQTASILIINDDVLVATAQLIDVGDLVFREGDSPNLVPLVDDICVEIVPAGYPGIAQVSLSTVDGSATRGVDYIGVSQVLTFQPGVNEMCSNFVSIVGDGLIEPTETFLVSLTSLNSDVSVSGSGNAVVTVLDDDQVDEVIVLIDDTPDVIVDAGTNTASVRASFTLRNDVVSALCSLGPDFPPVDCISRTVLFSGIAADTSTPLPFLVRAFNQLGDEVGNITRNVRIGLNNDCSVLFINMGEDDLFVFGNSVLIEWEEVGPVEDTECRLEQGDDIGEYFPCDSPHIVTALEPGNYGVKVRPNGGQCARRIRRTINFTIVQ